LSPCTSLNEDMETPAKRPPLCLPLSATLASSSRAAVPRLVTCIMHAYDGWVDMRKMSSGLASCRHCNANGYKLHMVGCTVHMLLHLHRLHEGRMMLVSSTVCCEATATCRMPKLYISTTQGMLPHIHHCTTYVYSVTVPGLLAQLHAMQTLP